MTDNEKHILEDSMAGKSEEEINEILKSKFRSITVHAPSLDDNLRPKFVLLNEVCPNEKETKNCCNNCDHFLGFINSEEEAIASYMSFNGFCDLK